MRTTSSFQFYCRESKQNKQGLSPVELSIVLSGSRKFINLPIKFNPTEFNKKRPSAEIVDALDAWRTRINLYMVEMMQSGIALTTENLRTIIQTGGVKNYTVGDLYDEYLTLLRARVGVDLSQGVYRKYELVLEKFSEYVPRERDVEAITNGIVKKFYADLNNKYDLSTSASMMTRLKTCITYGMDNNKIKINPFQGIKINKGKKDITYLSEAEIKHLLGLRLSNKSLQGALDCFLVMCGSGLAYSDLKELKREDIQEMNGVYYINKKRVKNKQEYTTPLFPWAMEIINKYDGVLPVKSNQKMNSYLGAISDIEGMQHLHCHLARHSFATLLLSKHIPISTISKTLGHSNVKMTSSFYAKVLDTTIIEEVSKIF